MNVYGSLIDFKLGFRDLKKPYLIFLFTYHNNYIGVFNAVVNSQQSLEWQLMQKNVMNSKTIETPMPVAAVIRHLKITIP